MATVTAPAPHALTDSNVVSFIKTDPLGVGFAAILSANPGNDIVLVSACNSVTGPGSGQLPAGQLTQAQVMDLIDGTEFGLLTTAQMQAISMLSNPQVDIGSASNQTKFATIFAASPKSAAAISAAASRAASPWEIYFGAGSFATDNILNSARNSGTGNNF